VTEDGQPFKPLKWWKQQQHAGNTHGGLLQMALDVLRCPGSLFLAKLVNEKNKKKAAREKSQGGGG
jgi:hypothetical protein